MDKIELLRGPDEQNIIYENHDSNSQTQTVSFHFFREIVKKKKKIDAILFWRICVKKVLLEYVKTITYPKRD